MDKQEFYSMVETRDDWSFSDVSRSARNELTHSYHKYPAKFIPQLAQALIEEYTTEGHFIWDGFCGSGTLNLEALRNGRGSIGTDINPISILISRVKTTPLEPESLRRYNEELVDKVYNHKIKSERYYISHDVLNGNLNVLKNWFSKESLLQLSQLLLEIKSQKNRQFRQFSLCAFSGILKRSSYWLNSSVKSQIDPEKNPEEPLVYFKRQIKQMEKANKELYEELGTSQTKVNIFKHNAKHRLPKRIPKFDCIITSPPYVVSYDYSDIFRLSTYFLHYQPDYGNFKRSFIGTPLVKNSKKHFNSSAPDQSIIKNISDTRIRKTLAEYYKDMSVFFKNAQHHIKKGGRLIMVVGDTELRGVSIPNVYLLYKIASNLNWSLENLYEREIPVKILPTSRDPINGRFTSKKNGNYSERYEKEYILVLKGVAN